jgi:hypothetical protein
VTYRILMIDTYHAPDPEEGSYLSADTFPSLEAAVAAAERSMDAQLRDHAEPGMDAARIMSTWKSWGDTPIVITPLGEAQATWSAQDYAEANVARFLKPAAA